MLDVDDLGELLERGAPARRARASSDAYGVGDLAAAAVADRDVDQQPVDVAGGLLGRLEPLGGLGGQQVERADRVEPPAPLRRRATSTASSMIASSGSSSLGGPVEVVGREQPQGDDLDADLLAPAEQRLDVVGAGPVAVRRCRRRRPWPSAGCRRASRRRAWGCRSGGQALDHAAPRRPGRAPVAPRPSTSATRRCVAASSRALDVGCASRHDRSLDRGRLPRRRVTGVVNDVDARPDRRPARARRRRARRGQAQAARLAARRPPRRSTLAAGIVLVVLSPDRVDPGRLGRLRASPRCCCSPSRRSTTAAPGRRGRGRSCAASTTPTSSC